MMNADVFQNTPLLNKAASNGIQVNSVPTVLYVSSDGTVREAEDIRNEPNMTNIVVSGELPPLDESLTQMSKDVDAASDSGSDSDVESEEPTSQSESIPETVVETVPDITLEETATNQTMRIPMTSSTFHSELPGVSVVPDTLQALPAQTSSSSNTKIQTGGSPWAAFLSSVAPAATLMGAYALLPKNARSSGLKRVSRRSKKMTRVSNA